MKERERLRRAENQALKNKSYEQDARILNQKKRDAALICPGCKDCEKIRNLDSMLVKEKLMDMKKEIENLYEKFKLEIDSIVEKGKCLEDHQPLYNKLHLKSSSFYYLYHWKLTCEGKLIARHESNPWEHADKPKTYLYAEKTWILPHEGTEGYIRVKESDEVLDIVNGLYNSSKVTFTDLESLMNLHKEIGELSDIKWEQKWEVIPSDSQGWFTIKNTARNEFLGGKGSLGEYIGEYTNKLEHAWVDIKSRNYIALKQIAEDLGQEYKCQWALWMENSSRPLRCICTICIDVEEENSY